MFQDNNKLLYKVSLTGELRTLNSAVLVRYLSIHVSYSLYEIEKRSSFHNERFSVPSNKNCDGDKIRCISC